MNNYSILLSVFLCFFLLVSPRRYFLFPFVVAACFIPMNQRIVLFDLDFTVIRILLLFGFLRLIMRDETRNIKWNFYDKIVLCWMVVGSAIYIVQQLNFGAIVYKSGEIFDTLGFYWLLRNAFIQKEDVFLTIKMFALLAIVTAPLIAMEKYQEISFFSIFGPVAAKFHRGRFRAAGPFPHYIMMGVFWAVLLPLFYSRVKSIKNSIFYWLAIAAALSNVYLSASSTPVFTVISAILFWKLYSIRNHGQLIFKTTCIFLFILHLIMKAPVWHLMSRVDVFGGSTGWHRFFLFDNFINHFSEWLVFGTKSTAHWGHAQTDITNQFVLEGVRGGLVTLVLFVIVVYLSISIPGKLSLVEYRDDIKWFAWGVCILMLSNFVTFWGVSYFGQMSMLLCYCFSLVGFCEEKLENSRSMA